MTQIITTELLGSDFAAQLNDASLQGLIDDTIAAFQAGDRVLATSIANLRVDAREWFDEAIAAASTLDSGLQRTQLEAIIDQLKPWISGRTVAINGEVKTLESAMLMLTDAPQVAKEVFAFGADKLPASNQVTFVDGRQAIMTATNTDDGAGALACSFAAADYYLGVPGEYTQKYAYNTRNVLGKDRKIGFVMTERTRVRFDLSRFLVNGSTYQGLDLDGNTTTDGSTPVTTPDPIAVALAALNGAASALTRAQTDAAAAAAAVPVKAAAKAAADTALVDAQAVSDDARPDAAALVQTKAGALTAAQNAVGPLVTADALAADELAAAQQILDDANVSGDAVQIAAAQETVDTETTERNEAATALANAQTAVQTASQEYGAAVSALSAIDGALTAAQNAAQTAADELAAAQALASSTAAAVVAATTARDEAQTAYDAVNV